MCQEYRSNCLPPLPARLPARLPACGVGLGVGATPESLTLRFEWLLPLLSAPPVALIYCYIADCIYVQCLRTRGGAFKRWFSAFSNARKDGSCRRDFYTHAGCACASLKRRSLMCCRPHRWILWEHFTLLFFHYHNSDVYLSFFNFSTFLTFFL